MTQPSSLGHAYRGTLVLIGLAAFVVVCAGVKLAAPVLIPVVLGGFIATVNIPQVFWLYRRRIPLALCVVLALLADAVALGAFSSLLVGSATQLSSRVPRYIESLRLAQQHASGMLRPLGVQTELREMLDPGAVLAWMASLAGDVAVLITNFVLALTIAGFLLLRFTRFSSGSAAGRTLRTEAVRHAVREMYRYIAIKTLTSIATGFLIGAWLWAIDADLPVLFGLVALLLNYIPTLGSIVAAGTAIGVALLQHGAQHAGMVALGYVVINPAIGNVFEPRVMGRALGLWPVVVLISVLFWGWLLGVIGAVLSALLTQTLKMVLLATPDLRAIGLALGPTPAATSVGTTPADLLEEAMPTSSRARPPGP